MKRKIHVYKSLFVCIVFIACSLAINVHAGGRKVLDGAVAPIFTGIDFNDKAFDLMDHLKKKPIVINFLSTRCVSCLSVVKTLEKYKSENKLTDDKMLFVYVSLDDWKKEAHVPPVWKEVFSKDKLLLNDGSRKISKMYEVDTLPATILIGKSGNIFYRRDDYNKFFEKEIKRELGDFILK